MAEKSETHGLAVSSSKDTFGPHGQIRLGLAGSG